MKNSDSEAQRNLGTLVAVYRSSLLKQILVIAFGLGFIVLASFCFVSWLDLKPRQADPTLIFIIGLVCLVFGLLLILGAFRLGGEELRFYEKGLTYQTRSSLQVVPWDRVGSVFEFVMRTSVNGIPSARSFTYSILTMDGEPLIFRQHLTGIKEIGERLKAEATKRDMPITNGIATDYVNKMLSVIPNEE